MTRDEQKIIKLMQYGIDSETAALLVSQGYSVTKLRNTAVRDLKTVLTVNVAHEVKGAVSRKPILQETVERLIAECDWSCCFCWDLDNKRPVVVHHIDPYERTQDNSYDNLVVLCPNHHADAHSKSSLAGDLLPKQLIRQRKRDFIQAIKEFKAGKRPPPGREPHAGYGWNEIMRSCREQVAGALDLYANKYDPELYVTRQVEEDFDRFAVSDATGFLIVDKSGQGKSNLLCALASKAIGREQPAILMRGDLTLVDENSLERILCSALGYEPVNFQSHLRAVAQTLTFENHKCFVFLDGISENSNLSLANRSLASLVVRLAHFGCFKLCIACRNAAWHRIGHDLPPHHFFQPSQRAKDSDRTFFVRDLSDEELDQCLLVYKRKYQMEFTLSATAKEQLRYPLMLRLFCEAYQGESLGLVSSVTFAKVFELYLTRKTTEIADRLSHQYEPLFLQRILRAFALEIWKSDDVNALSESQYQQIFRDFGVMEWNTILKEFQSEAIIEIEEDKLTLERRLRIVFDRLREYLLLYQLVASLPEQVRRAVNTRADYSLLLAHVRNQSAKPADYKLLSLVGMNLSDLEQRKEFLRLILEFDFYTYCACLAEIPPLGQLNKCGHQTPKELAKEIRRWYELIAKTAFPTLHKTFDPWNRKQDAKAVGIQADVSPECREISYHYEAVADKRSLGNLVSVKMTSSYPTWRLSVSSGEDEVVLHDPENGLMIPVFRGAPGGVVTRTINTRFMPRYPGDSFNIPERMALWDAWQETLNVITNDLLPFRPYILIAEKAWSIAQKIPNIKSDGLTLASFQRQLPHLLSQHSNKNRNVGNPAILNELYDLLSSLPNELTVEEYLPYQRRVKSHHRSRSTTWLDDDLREYLFQILQSSLFAYRIIVEAVFPDLKPVLNTYANMPCSVGLVTDRESVRYVLMPVPTEEESEMRGIVIPKGKPRIADPEVKFLLQNEHGESVSFVDGAHDQLRQLNKLRPPVHPIDHTMALDEFLSETPMNSLVRNWLLQDFRTLFCF